jgi:thymidylate synthase (FAD)
MKLIESKVEVIEQQPGLDGVYKQIELAGRTCYKSEDKITEDSAKGFVDRMIGSKHGAMLEHGTVYLSVPKEETEIIGFHGWCQYSKVRSDLVMEEPCNWLITTNMRVLVEHDRLQDLKYICEPTKRHEKRITARFTCDRGVSHEIVRHRVMSFAQESTRYCNYGKDKFGNEVTFIKPTWYNVVSDEQKEAFDDFLSISEEAYMALLDKWENRTPDKRYKTKFKGNPLTPQQARQVLPNALKTEIVVTGFESDWEHFFSLRSPKAGAQGAHPDIAKLADELYEKLNSVNK